MKSTTILVLAVLAFIATVMVVVDAKAVASRPHKGKHAPGKFGHKYRMTAEEEENESDSADDCIKVPDNLDLETICFDVQQWINDNEENDYKRAIGCDSVEPLRTAKSLMDGDDSCYLDWGTPSHLDFLEVKATVHKTNMTASKAKVNATATTHMKAIKMDRDTFLDRLQEVLGCSIKKIDYCNPVYHRTAEQCDFTDDCDECDDVEGCHWSTKDKLCVPDCDDCDDELIDKHQEPNYLEDSVPAHVVDDFGPEDCEDIDYRVECEHHTCCQWVAGDDDEDEDDHCAPHPDADQEVIESPCAAITDCDDCDGTTTCHWDTHELVCKNKDADVTMVKELSHTKEPNASDDKKSTEAAEISKKKK